MGFLERGAKNRGVTIGTDFTEGLPDIVSDRGQLQQVFLNIMGNALDAVPDGGKVDIACSQTANGGLLVRVTDNGKGMSPEVIKTSSSPSIPPRRRRATVWACLSPTVSCAVSAARSPWTAPKARARRSASRCRLHRRNVLWRLEMALRVLLADDEKEFVETLAERLDLRGIEVRVALDGKTALTTLDEMAAAEALPDVMVVDLLMPGMTGDAVLQQVRQKYPGLPVIVLTGHDSVDDSGDSPGTVPSPA